MPVGEKEGVPQRDQRPGFLPIAQEPARGQQQEGGKDQAQGKRPVRNGIIHLPGVMREQADDWKYGKKQSMPGKF
jgi:hypothetical protein